MSIDEMIKAGKTLSEIQNELRKQVAARDEKELNKTKSISIARSALIKAMINWYIACGIPFDPKEDSEDYKLLDTIMKQQEENLLAGMKIIMHSENKDSDLKELLKYIRT